MLPTAEKVGTGYGVRRPRGTELYRAREAEPILEQAILRASPAEQCSTLTAARSLYFGIGKTLMEG